jgi:hypothetical protein
MSFVPTRVPVPPRRPGTVVVTVDGVTRRGRAIDVRGTGLSVEALVAAVYEGSTPGPAARGFPSIQVDCDPAGPVHVHVDHLPSPSFALRDALVAAARSRGFVPPVADRLERARTALAAASDDLGPVDLSAAKRRVAEAGTRERRLDERVATLRGRLTALREVGADTTEVEADLADAVGSLTEVETERIAAEQRLAQVERAARTARDRRQRRLRLADRVDNLRRRARQQLVSAVFDDFVDALEALPGDVEVGAEPGSYRGDSTTAALAVVRIARVDAPLVLSVERFGSPAEAATRLGAPVIQR